MSEIDWRYLICDEQTCAWQNNQPSIIAFAPEKLQYQQSWQIINHSQDHLHLNYQFHTSQNFPPYWQYVLWLQISHEASPSCQIVAQNYLPFLEQQFWTLSVGASSSAIINFHWHNKNWNYLLSQKMKNSELTYDWLINIKRSPEATASPPLEPPTPTDEEIETENPPTNEATTSVTPTPDTSNTTKDQHLTQTEAKESLTATPTQNHQAKLAPISLINSPSPTLLNLASPATVSSIVTADLHLATSTSAQLKSGEASSSILVPEVLGLETQKSFSWWWLIFALLIFLSLTFRWWWRWCHSFDFSQLS